MKDIHHYLAITIIAFNILSMAIMVYVVILLVFPLKPIEFFGPNKVKTKVVKAGDRFIYTANYCRKTNGPGKVTRTLVDSLLYVLPEVSAINAPIGCGKRDIVITIPKDVPTGEYHLHIKGTFQVNAIRNYVAEVDTEKFTIINASEEGQVK